MIDSMFTISERLTVLNFPLYFFQVVSKSFMEFRIDQISLSGLEIAVYLNILLSSLLKKKVAIEFLYCFENSNIADVCQGI